MRWLIVCSSLIPFALSLACTSTDPSADDPALAPTDQLATAPVEAEPNPPNQADGPEYVLAVVGQTGVEHCPTGDFPATWLDLQPTLGWIPASGLDAETFAALIDLPVLARGRASAAPDRPPLGVEPKPCPVMQMRSDWVTTPGGIRVQHTHPPIPHFQATSVRRLDELTVTREGEEIVVSFMNPLPFALAQVQLELHYEGCYGKPGSTADVSEAITLEPGQTLTERFGVFAEQAHAGPRKGGPSAHQHLANALVLRLGEQDVPGDAAVHADLSVELGDLGLELACPDK
jgi:hypothetical protein